MAPTKSTEMTNYGFMLLGFLVINLMASRLSDTSINRNKYNQNVNFQDTIEFALRWDFKGDCGNDCYSFLGTDTILKLNEKSVEKGCNHIFAKCPSDLKLFQNKTYRFLALAFNPDPCSTIIDTCAINKYYLLVKEID